MDCIAFALKITMRARALVVGGAWSCWRFYVVSYVGVLQKPYIVRHGVGYKLISFYELYLFWNANEYMEYTAIHFLLYVLPTLKLLIRGIFWISFPAPCYHALSVEYAIVLGPGEPTFSQSQAQHVRSAH